MRKLFFVVLAVAMMLPFGAAFAEHFSEPTVMVQDQVVLGDTVRIDVVYSMTPGFVVIHVDNGGAPGPVAGWASVNQGESRNVDIEIDTAIATPVLYAMLHTDDGAAGVYEFDGSSGLDNPIADSTGAVVTPAFNVTILDAADALLTDGMVTVKSVTVAAPSWVVIHATTDGSFGAVLGQTLVDAGTTANVMVDIGDAGEGATSVFPMLHVDDGVAGEYEFGAVEGADGPIIVNGAVATYEQMIVPSLRVEDQIVLHGDGMEMMDMAASLNIDSVVSDGPGVVVVHVDNEGAPGPVAGWAFVNAGSSSNVVVPLDQEVELTPVLWPMLHVDDGAVGTYEFDGSSGLDNPVVVGDAVVVTPVNVAPSLNFQTQALNEGTLTIDSALIDGQGWIAVHSGAEGSPGPVIATYPLRAGLNSDIVIEVDAMEAGALVFPMLHYDTGALGAYEFGTVEGADGPTIVGGNVVVAPLEISQ